MRRMEPEKLRQWMDQHGETPAGLAVALEVNRATVYRWLNGATPIPKSVELALEVLGRK